MGIKKDKQNMMGGFIKKAANSDEEMISGKCVGQQQEDTRIYFGK